LELASEPKPYFALSLSMKTLATLGDVSNKNEIVFSLPALTHHKKEKA